MSNPSDEIFSVTIDFQSSSNAPRLCVVRANLSNAGDMLA